MHRCIFPVFTAFLVVALALASTVRAEETQTAAAARGHGQRATDHQFPSHVFRLEAHQPQRVQLAFHSGLTQPLLLRGFNAAVDVRYKRLIVTYSHGEGLELTRFLGST